MLSPEALAVEIASHLPANNADITLEDSRYWCRVAENLPDDKLIAFIRITTALSSPVSMLFRELVLQKMKDVANVQ